MCIVEYRTTASASAATTPRSVSSPSVPVRGDVSGKRQRCAEVVPVDLQSEVKVSTAVLAMDSLRECMSVAMEMYVESSLTDASSGVL